jgi:hypothetical protein
MNGDQQQERSKALSDIRKRLDTMDSDFLAIVVQTVNDQKKENALLREEIQVAIRGEGRKRQEQALEQRAYVDGEDHNIARALLAFVMMPWWRRFVWFFFGGDNLQRVDRFTRRFL